MPPSARPSPILAVAMALVVGLLMGWALSQVLEPLSRPVLGQASAHSSQVGGTTAAAEESLRPAQSPRADEMGLESDRVAASAVLPTATPSTTEQTEGPGSAPAGPDLLAELSTFLRSGALERKLASNQDELLLFLVQHYMQVSSPARALELLRHHPHPESWLYENVANSLRAAGDLAGAAEAYRAALERDPFEMGWIEALRQLDPAAALATLEGKRAEMGLAAEDVMGLQRARLLVALGRREEALALVDQALAGEPLDEAGWAAVEEIDPALAERALRERAGEDESGILGVRLARLLAAGEHKEEAARVLEDLLRRAPAQNAALKALLEIAPERALGFLEAAPREELDSRVWRAAAAYHQREGRIADAIDAWMRTIDLNMSDDDACRGLREHAPERLWAHCARVTAGTRDDELLGDVADLYWQSGRTQEAIELWKRARLIDPTDGEWTGKLRNVALGQDPL